MNKAYSIRPGPTEKRAKERTFNSLTNVVAGGGCNGPAAPADGKSGASLLTGRSRGYGWGWGWGWGWPSRGVGVYTHMHHKAQTDDVRCGRGKTMEHMQQTPAAAYGQQVGER